MHRDVTRRSGGFNPKSSPASSGIRGAGPGVRRIVEQVRTRSGLANAAGGQVLDEGTKLDSHRQRARPCLDNPASGLFPPSVYSGRARHRKRRIRRGPGMVVGRVQSTPRWNVAIADSSSLSRTPRTTDREGRPHRRPKVTHVEVGMCGSDDSRRVTRNDRPRSNASMFFTAATYPATGASIDRAQHGHQLGYQPSSSSVIG